MFRFLVAVSLLGFFVCFMAIGSKIYAQGSDVEEIVMATLSFKTLDYSQSILTLRKAVNWGLIAREYAQLAGI